VITTSRYLNVNFTRIVCVTNVKIYPPQCDDVAVVAVAILFLLNNHHVAQAPAASTASIYHYMALWCWRSLQKALYCPPRCVLVAFSYGGSLHLVGAFLHLFMIEEGGELAFDAFKPHFKSFQGVSSSISLEIGCLVIWPCF